MNRRKDVLIFAFLFLINIFSWSVFSEINSLQQLEVVYFDVGQGDSALIKTENNHLILIDGGPGKTILEKLPVYVPFWRNKIDLIILTHPHQDHLEGLVYVLENYKVENILWTGAIEDNDLFRKWENLIKNSKSNILIAKAGEKIRTDNFFLNILYPFESLEGAKLKDANPGSIILKLGSDKTTYLFTGDTYEEIEKDLIEYEKKCQNSEEQDELCEIMILKSDVLKVAHHGSKFSSSENFIRNVYPLAAVISSGRDNSYGHPHKETLEVFIKYGIRILRTDEEGDIKIIFNNEY